MSLQYREDVSDSWENFPEDHNYQKEIKRLGLAGKLSFIQPREWGCLMVCHDMWCALLNNAPGGKESNRNKKCDCNPNIYDPKGVWLNSPKNTNKI